MAALVEHAIEGSTYVVTSQFKDEAGTTVVPISCSWSLRDNYKAIVNSRSAVALTPATTVTVILSGADLAYEPNARTMRTFTVTGVYNGVYGNNLPLAGECTFKIDPLVGVTDA